MGQHAANPEPYSQSADRAHPVQHGSVSKRFCETAQHTDQRTHALGGCDVEQAHVVPARARAVHPARNVEATLPVRAHGANDAVISHCQRAVANEVELLHGVGNSAFPGSDVALDLGDSSFLCGAGGAVSVGRSLSKRDQPIATHLRG